MPGIQFGPPIFQAVSATPKRLSNITAGMPTSYQSNGIAFSPDGNFAAYYAQPISLFEGETSVRWDIFLRNLATGEVTRLSVTADGVRGNHDSVVPVFLPGGRRVAFLSDSDNLVAGDTNGARDIFIKDLSTGVITRVSTQSDGSQLTMPEFFSTSGISAPAFSPDGTKMVFTWEIAGAVVYMKDLVTGALTIEVPASFSEGPNMPRAHFSSDGTKLIYRQYLPGHSEAGIYIKDLATGTVTLVSTNSAGVAANGSSSDADLSADGTLVAFVSSADNLVAGQRGGLFIKNLITGEVTLVASGGTGPVFSPDGTRLAFTGGDSLSPRDTNHFLDIYVKDLLTGEISLVSANVDDTQSPIGASQVAWSPDGLSVGFIADNLVQPDTNGATEIYMSRLELPARYVEGGPPVQVVPSARVLDLGSTDYDQGSLTVAITGGGVEGDQLTLALSSVAGESVAVSGNQVFVNNAMVGTIAGSATSLTISFNASANNAVVELLTEAVRISTTSHNPTDAVRTITFTLVDGDGVQEGVTDTTSFIRKVAFIPVSDQHLAGTSGDDVLHGALGGDTIDGMAGNDIIQGGGGNDLIDGGSGQNTIYGDGGHDRLAAAGSSGNRFFGGNDSDVIVGGSGDDRIEGGGGGDWLTGGAGADTFVYRFSGDSAGYSMRSDGKKVLNDVITDFTSGIDKIDLQGIDAIDGGDMRDAFTFIGTAAFTHHAGELRYEIVGGQANIYADTNGDGFADMHIVAMTPTLAAADFIL